MADLRIERVRADLVSIGRANLVLVRVDVAGGLTGAGETLVRRHDRTAQASALELGETLIGRDARRLEDSFEKLYRDSFWVGGPLHAAARSAIDIALWDAVGRHYSLPVYQLLGGRSRPQLPVYCHCPAGSSPETFAANLREVRARGFTAAKTTLPLFYGGEPVP